MPTLIETDIVYDATLHEYLLKISPEINPINTAIFGRKISIKS